MNIYTLVFCGISFLWFLVYILIGDLVAGTAGVIAAEIAYLGTLLAVGYRLMKS